MVKFIRGSFEEYKTLYIDGNETPDQDTIYYLYDQNGHQHIFMGEKEYAVTPIIYGQQYAGICPAEVFLTKQDYEDLKEAGQIDAYTKYSIYVPDPNEPNVE